jgi:hypothetical protein
LPWIERQSTGTGGVHKWVGVSDSFDERLVRTMEEKKKQLQVGILSRFVVGCEPTEACAYSK